MNNLEYLRRLIRNIQKENDYLKSLLKEANIHFSNIANGDYYLSSEYDED